MIGEGGGLYVDVCAAPYYAAPSNTAAANTTAIQAAINAYDGTPYTLYFSTTGVYEVNPLSVTGCIKMEDLYQRQVELKLAANQASASGHLLYLDTGSKGSRVKGFKLNGNGANQTQTSLNCILVNDDEIEILDNEIYGSSKEGVVFHAVDGVIFRHNHVHTIADTHLVARHSSTKAKCCNNCFIEYNTFTGDSGGVTATMNGKRSPDVPTTGMRFNFNKLDRGSDIDKIALQTFDYFLRGEMIGNHITGGNMSISLNGFVGSTCADNQCYDFDSSGIEVARYTADSAITGNVINGNNGVESAGFQCPAYAPDAGATAAQHVTIADNTVKNCRRGATINSHDIVYSANVMRDITDHAYWIKEHAYNIQVIGGRIDGATQAFQFTGSSTAANDPNDIEIYDVSVQNVTTVVNYSPHVAADLTEIFLRFQRLGTYTNLRTGVAVGYEHWEVKGATGVPNIIASAGSTWTRRDGGASTSFYVKESSGGSTGWVPK
jgi:hypothetical protein